MIEIYLPGRVPLTSTVTTTNADPTAFTVEWSFPPTDTPPSAWTAGVWQEPTGQQLGTNRWRAVTVSPLVGAAPATVVLAAGVYDVWLRIAGGSAGVPLLPCGQVRCR